MIYEGEGEATSMFENNSTSIGYTHTCVVKLESYVYPNHLNHFFSLAGAANLIFKNLFLASTHSHSNSMPQHNSYRRKEGIVCCIINISKRSLHSLHRIFEASSDHQRYYSICQSCAPLTPID
jgi:hypothetical protein